MRCILCGAPRMADDMLAFSYEGFKQTMSIFRITPLEGKEIVKKIKRYLPIYVCPEHFYISETRHRNSQ